MRGITGTSKSRLAETGKKVSGVTRSTTARLRRKKSAEVIVLRFCYNCGAVLSSDFKLNSSCPACDKIVVGVSHQPPVTSEIEQSAALELEMLKWIGKGYYVVRQRSDFAELRKPKRFSLNWASAWFVAGIPLPGLALPYAAAYAIWHVARKERSIFLIVDSKGKLRTEKVTG